jgi:hypothetical protein
MKKLLYLLLITFVLSLFVPTAEAATTLKAKPTLVKASKKHKKHRKKKRHPRKHKKAS